MVEVYGILTSPSGGGGGSVLSCQVSDYGQGGTQAHNLYYLCPEFGTALSIYRLGSRERTYSHPCVPKASAHRYVVAPTGIEICTASKFYDMRDCVFTN